MARRGPVGPNDHVDIIHNQWSAGTQTVEARVSIANGRVRFRGALASQWRNQLVGSFQEAGLVDPWDNPEGFVSQLHERYRNDYFFATQPHDRGQCPFARHRVLPMPSVPIRGVQGSPAIR
jgi:hypothetical protein